MIIALLIAGILFFLAGALGIFLGIPVKEFSFGNTLILAGVVAGCTGMLTLGLAAVIRELKQIAERLESGAVAAAPSPQPAAAVAPRSQPVENPAFAANRNQGGPAADSAPPPWHEETAARASGLATQLRLHLVEDRRQTWLHHAVTESAVLDPVTRIEDPDGLAASFSARQRDGLFSAIWMLVGSTGKSATSLVISISRGADAGPHVHSLRVLIEATGVPRRQIDPSAWQAIRRVGRYTETGSSAMVRIDVDCLVDATEDQ